MLSAFLGATCLHLFLSTSLSEGVIDASEKGHVVLAVFFIVYNLYYTFGGDLFAPVAKAPVVKTESPAAKVAIGTKKKENESKKSESKKKKKV
jgi:hypothetical protein